MSLNMRDAALGYRKLRTLKKKVADRHKEELKPINEKMVKLEAWMLNELNKNKEESSKTEEGTIYKHEVVSIKVEDWPTVFKFLIENDLTHMLVQNVGAANVKEYMEANGAPPPGLSVNRSYVARVRSPSKK